MRWREFLIVLGGAVAVFPFVAHAQQSAMPTLAVSQETDGLSARGTGCTKPLRPLVVKVGFKNIPRRPMTSWIEQNFLAPTDDYIREMSYGATCLTATITDKWYVLPSPLDRYFVPWQNLKVDRNNLRNLVSDTLGQVERDFNLERYDFLVFVLAANAKEWGNQGLNTYPGVLGWKDKSQLVTPGGRRYRGGIAIYALSARPGKVFHNIAHILGGVRDGRRALPDMYDQRIASSSDKKAGQDAESDQRKSQIYMGAWDPMSCNICAQRPGVPGVSSWTKLRLGWLGDSKVRTVEAGETSEVLLAPLSDGDASTLALRIPLGPTTYYLVENRQRIGHDTNVPNAGVLILYGDDAMAEPELGRSPVRLIDANPSVPFLDGAAFDIGGRAIFKDRPNMVEIELIKKIGTAYVIRVSRGLLPPDQAVAPQWNTTQPSEKPNLGGLCRDGNLAHCEVACSKGVKRACDRLRGGL